MDIAPLKDWWGLLLAIGGAILAAITVIIRNTIKIYKASEVLKQVAVHDEKLLLIAAQYKSIEEDTKDLKESVVDLSASLDKHIVDQKGEFKAINSALYSILDLLNKDDEDGIADAALKKLREYTLGK